MKTVADLDHEFRTTGRLELTRSPRKVLVQGFLITLAVVPIAWFMNQDEFDQPREAMLVLGLSALVVIALFLAIAWYHRVPTVIDQGGVRLKRGQRIPWSDIEGAAVFGDSIQLFLSSDGWDRYQHGRSSPVRAWNGANSSVGGATAVYFPAGDDIPASTVVDWINVRKEASW